MIIRSYCRDYSVEFIDSMAFIQQISENRNSFFVIDKNVFELYREMFSHFLKEDAFFVLEAVEKNKSIEKALEIVSALVRLNTRKNTVLVAVGGGIVQDVTCFVASVLYRGIEWNFMPTTLLAQTDSCIGSKSSINYGQYKNLIGTFYPPKRIGIDLAYLDTISDRDYRNGLGEIAKIAIMRGQDSYREFRKILPALLARDGAKLEKTIENTLSFKKSIIEVDEFDRDYRNILNYGHTFGHALESVSEFGIPHGQGVAMGMLLANEISLGRGLITNQYRDEMFADLTQIAEMTLLKPEYLESAVFISAMQKDKKFQGQTHTCILVDQHEAKKYSDISNQEVSDALQILYRYCCG